MFDTYTPADWYWARETGQVFSSARSALITEGDLEYQAWLDGGGKATPWPRDEQGAQSDRALDEVLKPFGLRCSPLSPEELALLINAERDRRIATRFTFGGRPFAFDPDSKQRVTGAATLAGFAIAQGAKAGDLLWHGGTSPFVWIADDNSLVQMDAPTCFAFGQAAAAHETAHIFAARTIKDMNPIPQDYADDSRWP